MNEIKFCPRIAGDEVCGLPPDHSYEELTEGVDQENKAIIKTIWHVCGIGHCWNEQKIED